MMSNPDYRHRPVHEATRLARPSLVRSSVRRDLPPGSESAARYHGTELAAPPQANLLTDRSLQDLMSGHVERFGQYGVSVELVGDLLDRIDSEHTGAVALPATNSDRLDLVSNIAHNFPFVAVVAAVIDPTGLISSQAINAGASWVLNLLIPPEYTVPAIAQQLLTHLDCVVEHESRLPVQLAADEPAAGSADCPGGPCGLAQLLAPTEADHELLHLLIDGQSTSELARRFYCSERSMYRRLRNVYDRIGVSGRYELMHRLAG